MFSQKGPLLFSHLCPHLPEGQRHLPEDRSHGASPTQSHDSAQFSPYLPASHPVKHQHFTVVQSFISLSSPHSAVAINH